MLNGGSTESPYSAEEIAGTRAGLNPYAYPNVNWYDELFKDQAFNQNFNVNIRGGGKRVDYFSSVTVNHETGMIKNRSKDFFSYNNNINVMRYSFQNNINAYLGKDSRLSLRLNVQLRKTKQPNISMNDLFAGAINTSPVEAPVYFPDDGVTTHIKWGVNDRLKPGQQQNPVAQLASGYQDNFRSTVVAALEFEQKLNFITEGLRFKALASFKNWSSTTNSASAGWNKYHLQDFSVDDNGVYSFVTRLQNESGGEVSTDLKPGVANSGDRRFYFQAIMDYNRTFGKHDVNAMFIYNQDELVTQLFSGDLIAALPKRKQGVAARLSYAYDGKYLAEVNMGYNGSENFAKGHRWGFFPSVSLGWVMSEEDFFKDALPKIDYFKLRGSFGILGSDNVSAFLYRKSYSYTNNGVVFGSTPNTQGTLSNTVAYPNERLTWEKTKSYNLGFDLSAWNGLLGVEFDVFYKYTYDILQSVSNIYPPSLGGHYPSSENTGTFDNRGFEIALKHRNRIGEFSYSLNGNLSYAHNRILSRTQADNTLPWQSVLGSSVGELWGLKALGLYQSEEEIANSPQVSWNTPRVGDIKYADINGDGKIDSNDRIKISRGIRPEMMFALMADANYKGFDLSVQFQGAALCDKMLQYSWQDLNGATDMTPMTRPWYANWDNAPLYLVENSWRPDHTNAEYPRLTVSSVSHSNNAQQSDFWKRNGAYLRLKNVTLGYTLPKAWTNKMGLSNIRVYANGTNLLTFTDFKYIDPESTNVATGYYPQQRTFSFGIDVRF